MPPRNYVRRRKLIKPRLQLKLTCLFVGLVALSLLLQYTLFSNRLTHLALRLPNDSDVLLNSTNQMLGQVLALSFLMFLPLTLLVGIMATFRIAGPVYRIEKFLESVEAGQCPPDFHLRKGDELQELAGIVVSATRPLRTAKEQAQEDQAA